MAIALRQSRIIPHAVFAAYAAITDTFANLLLTGETDGFAIDATDVSATPAYVGASYAGYVSVKDTGTPANNLSNTSLDTSNLVNSGTSPKMVTWPTSPYVRWTPHNYTKYSQDLTTLWGNVGTTESGDTVTAPDGTSTADTVIEDSANSRHIIQNDSATTLAATQHCCSVYLKRKDRQWGHVNLTDANGNYTQIIVDLDTGTVTDSNTSGMTSGSSTVTSVGSGWYRCSVTATITSGTVYPTIGLSNSATPAYASGSPTYAGDGSSGMYVWGVQVNRGPIATPYLVTTTTARIGIPQSYDTAASKYGVLVEPAATNLVLQSEDNTTSWNINNVTRSSNATTAPNGATTADSVTTSAVNSFHDIETPAMVIGSGSTNTASVYLKYSSQQYVSLIFATDNAAAWAVATVDLSGGSIVKTGAGVSGTYVSSSITSIGNGWYRVSVTGAMGVQTNSYIQICTNDSSNPTYGNYGLQGYSTAGGDIFYMWGAQMEASSVATSYIPTLGGTATRAADTVTAATTSFQHSNTADTVYADIKVFEPPAANFWEVYQSTGNRYNTFSNGAGTVRQFNSGGGIFNIGSYTTATRLQVSAAFANGDLDGSVDGGAVVSDAGSFTPTGVTTLILGGYAGGPAFNGNMFIYRLAHVPRQVQTDSGNLPTWRYNF